MIRLFVVVMSANLALLVLFTDLFNQNADLKGLRGGGCWVEVEHGCAIVNGRCQNGTYAPGYTCQSKLVQSVTEWYSLADATINGHDTSIPAVVHCWDSYDCEEIDDTLGGIYCVSGNWQNSSAMQNQETLTGAPADLCQPAGA